MNRYKIELKEILRKNIIVNAENEDEATEYVENVLLKSDLLDLGIKDLDAFETKILEKNGQKVNNFDEEIDTDIYKAREEIELEKCQYKLRKIEEAREDLEEILEEIECSTNEISDILFDCFDAYID